jgi:hypothetical protein
VQEYFVHVAIRGVIPIVADAMSAIGNRLSVGQDRLLQKQTTELTAVLSASVSQRPRVPVVILPEDVKDGILKADGLQRALPPVTAAPATRRGLRPARRAVRWSRSCGNGSRGWKSRRRCGSWRSGSKVAGGTPPLRQRFYVRRKLVRWVEARAATAEVSLAVVATAIDRLGPSPDRFYKGIGQGAGSLCECSTEIDINTFYFLPESI